ncbi:MAG: T9SS type A sorting domain-containing protein [Saprospiraceae bacterium]
MSKYLPLLFLVLLVTTSSVLSAQTSLDVYQIFKTKCAACHSNNDPQNGLDLQGAGNSDAEKMASVRNNIVNVTPNNSFAAAQGQRYIYPGRVDKSMIFRKINQGLDSQITLHSDEGDPMPNSPFPSLSDPEKELIRQWILYGAPATGDLKVNNVLVTDMIEEYYDGNGAASFPDGPPPAPAPGEGFQIKMGPFFLPPNGEVEYLQKYALDLPAKIEVNRLDFKIASYSHHFILYKFKDAATNTSAGLRTNSNHFNIDIVGAVQQAEDIKLPEGTSFFWNDDQVLDLNSHYINYSNTMIYQAEAYLNVYTQPSGTAAQEMITELLPNISIPIPNNGNLIGHNKLNLNLNHSTDSEVFIWALSGHTHKYGKDYTAKLYTNNTASDLIYDAKCPEGVPGCPSPFFDYQHIPIRYFDPLFPANFNGSSAGVQHQAKWVNSGPSPVGFGFTSDDEMMILIIMYTNDTTGIAPTSLNEKNPLDAATISPNPMINYSVIEVPENLGPIQLQLFDILGNAIRPPEQHFETRIRLERRDLVSGVYLYRLADQQGRFHTGKIVVQ